MQPVMDLVESLFGRNAPKRRAIGSQEHNLPSGPTRDVRTLDRPAGPRGHRNIGATRVDHRVRQKQTGTVRSIGKATASQLDLTNLRAIRQRDLHREKHARDMRRGWREDGEEDEAGAAHAHKVLFNPDAVWDDELPSRSTLVEERRGGRAAPVEEYYEGRSAPVEERRGGNPVVEPPMEEFYEEGDFYSNVLPAVQPGDEIQVNAAGDLMCLPEPDGSPPKPIHNYTEAEISSVVDGIADNMHEFGITIDAEDGTLSIPTVRSEKPADEKQITSTMKMAKDLIARMAAMQAEAGSPEEPAAEETTPEETTPEETTPEEPAAEEPAAEEMTPEETTPEEPAAEETTTEEPAAEETTPEATTTEEEVFIPEVRVFNADGSVQEFGSVEEAEAEVPAAEVAVPAPTRSNLMRKNRAQLVIYATRIGVSFTSRRPTKTTMVDDIMEHFDSLK